MRPVARIAQSVEQGIENPRVLGSIPSPGTTIHKALLKSEAFFISDSGRYLVVPERYMFDGLFIIFATVSCFKITLPSLTYSLTRLPYGLSTFNHAIFISHLIMMLQKHRGKRGKLVLPLVFRFFCNFCSGEAIGNPPRLLSGETHCIRNPTGYRRFLRPNPR